MGSGFRYGRYEVSFFTSSRISPALTLPDSFRLDITRSHADWLLKTKDYANALKFDQLNKYLSQSPSHPPPSVLANDTDALSLQRIPIQSSQDSTRRQLSSRPPTNTTSRKSYQPRYQTDSNVPPYPATNPRLRMDC